MDINALELFGHMIKTRSCQCLRLDFEKDKIPQEFFKKRDPLFSFNKYVVDQTYKYVVAYKLNPSLYLSFGEKGLVSLNRTISYIKKKYPEKLVILDLKFGDFGFRSEKYAQTIFNEMKADAITLSPYIGGEDLKPFFSHPGKWGVLMALTPNKGAEDFQFSKVTPWIIPPWEEVISRAVSWEFTNVDNLILIVADRFDTTERVETLEKARSIAPSHFFLVPNVKAGNGSIAKVIAKGTNDVCGLLLDHDHDDGFYENPGKAAFQFRLEIADALHLQNFF